MYLESLGLVHVCFFAGEFYLRAATICACRFTDSLQNLSVLRRGRDSAPFRQKLSLGFAMLLSLAKIESASIAEHIAGAHGLNWRSIKCSCGVRAVSRGGNACWSSFRTSDGTM